jgi:hypothetical protein
MQSYVLLNTPGEPATSASWWSVSGAEDTLLRDCLERLGDHVVTNENGRWLSPVVYGLEVRERPTDPCRSRSRSSALGTLKGAHALASLLPKQLPDVREELIKRFGWARGSIEHESCRLPQRSYRRLTSAPPTRLEAVRACR